MTGKVIDNSATGILILIIPIAVLMVLLLQAWPVLLALLVLSISIKVWQQYQWKQWSKEVNPYFNQLIKDNQGCLTPLDLSMKANLSGSDARRYLDKKSEEFGAQRQVYEDKGTVYYFLTASALGSIFDESEPLLDLEGEASSPPAPQLIEAPLQTDTPELPSDLSDLPEPSEDAFSTHEIEEALEPLPQVENKEMDSQDEEPEDLWTATDQEAKDSRSLIQAELAKRLDVHSSTVGKRKSDPDFSEWSQSRDPEGIAWEYSLLTKEFLPVEKPLSEE
ncbi:MAG TPA: hypothetical protein V6D37_12260 [Candidatus Sericytochromatia bacterium]